MKLKMKPLAQACAFSLLAGSVIAATPAGTSIMNKVTASYSDSFGNSFTSESNTIEITIREVHAIDLAGDASKEVSSTNATAETVHTLTNNGNVAATYSLAATNDATGDTVDATSVKIYHDADNSGTLNGTEADTEITSFDLTMGASAQFIVVSTLPAGISDTDTLNVTLTATDAADNTVTDSNAIALTFVDGSVPTTPIKIWNQADGGNCHAYTWIQTPTTIHDAKTAAANLVYGGVNGHLVSLTSDAENVFAFTQVMLPDSGVQTAWTGLEATNGTNYAWPTGEAYSFEDFNGTEGQNSDENYVAMKHGVGWFDVGETRENILRKYGYLVEFDTPCAQPEVEVALTAAKDVACDGTADGAFGNVDLAGMASGECAIMRTKATNNGTVAAKGLLMDYVVPQHLSYMPNTLKFDGVSKTDATDDDAAAIDNGTIQFVGGDLAVGATSPTGEFQVKVQ